MKKKEIATALGLSVALSMTVTGCASQADVDALNNQVTELNQQIETLQTELNDAQSESTNASQKNTELEKQVAELQEELTLLNEEFTVDEEMIADADNFADNASINVTNYSQKNTAVYSKANESEEYKIANLDMNTECYVVATFSDATAAGMMWSAIASLVTTDSDGNKTYQMISDVKRSDERTKNSKIDFMLRNAVSITVDNQTIKADELAENQEIRIVYARTSLLSNSEVKQEKKQQTQTPTGNGGGSTGGGGNWWDDPNLTVGIEPIGCPGNHASDSYVPNTGWH